MCKNLLSCEFEPRKWECDDDNEEDDFDNYWAFLFITRSLSFSQVYMDSNSIPKLKDSMFIKMWHFFLCVLFYLHN